MKKRWRIAHIFALILAAWSALLVSPWIWLIVVVLLFWLAFDFWKDSQKPS